VTLISHEEVKGGKRRWQQIGTPTKGTNWEEMSE
jgi:hypothetical protein